MDKIILLFIGGGTGTLLRYWTSLATVRWLQTPVFPAGTFAVNLAGCFVIGILAGWNNHQPFAENTRLLLFTGILGGFTTFSAFSLETLQLFRQGASTTALLYVTGSTVGGVFLSLAGFMLIKK